jgi:hypothetical protein
MSKHTLEQVLEALINKEDDRASELLHQFFVQKGKSIYEELSSFDEQLEEDEEADLEEGIGGAPAKDFEEEIIADETDLEDERLFSEADEEGEDPMSAEEPTEPEATADLAMGDEMPAEEPAAEGDLLQKADDAIDELKAIFAEIMGTQGGDEMPADEPAMGGEDMPAEEPTEESFRAFGEGVMPKPVSAPTPGDNGANTKSPVSSGSKISANGASAVKVNSGNTAGGKADSAKEDDAGNVNKVGNAKAPALKGVAVPKMNSDTAANKTSPVAK